MYTKAKDLKKALDAGAVKLQILGIDYEQYKKMGKIYEFSAAVKKTMARMKKTRMSWPDTAR